MVSTRRSGRANRLAQQVGEYLVAAELARRNLISTTFSGNVPHYDIVATDSRGRHVSVQVKASRGHSWQFSMDRFCSISFHGKRQKIEKVRSAPVRRLVIVLVLLGSDGERDRFFVTSWAELRGIAVQHHREWLMSHGGRRPRNPRSLHTAISVKSLEPYEDQWGTVRRALA